MTITTKQLRSFLASERAGLDGIGFNDAWNLQVFSLTNAQAATIRAALVEEYGMRSNWPKSPSVAALNRRHARLEVEGTP